MFDILSRYKIDINEYGYMAEDLDDSKDMVKVIIPKIVPFLNANEPRVYTKSFNPNIFVNNKDSSPITRNNIKLRNYLIIKRYNDTYNRKFKSGERIICEIMNENIKDIYMTNKIGGSNI